MSNERIYFSPPYMTGHEVDRLSEIISSGWIAPAGPHLGQFEEALTEKFGYRSALALNSGTAALHLALKLAGVLPGDRVVVGTFTFVAAANAVIYENAEPVFMDSEPGSWNLDPSLLEAYLTKHNRLNTLPRAVIVTHIYGIPAMVMELKAICDRFGVRMIEDAAEALGSKQNGQALGGFGDYAALSFNGNKILTTGGGGALVCADSEEGIQALKYATQSKEEADHYDHVQIGYNYRMSNVLAGIGLAQLEAFESILDKKRQLHEQYRELLSPASDVSFREELPGSAPNHWITPILIGEQSPSTLLRVFESNNIEARRFWKPLHLQPLYRDAEYIGGSVAESLFDTGICLPSGAGMTRDQLSRVCAVLLS